MTFTRLVSPSIRFVFIVAALVLASCREQAPAKTAEDVHSALDSAEKRLTWVDYRIGQETWDQLTEGHSDSLSFFAGLRAAVLNDPSLSTVRAGDSSQLSSEQERRRFQLLRRQAATANIDQSDILKPLRDSLDRFFGEPWCQFDDHVVTPAEAAFMMTHDRRRTNRELAYRAKASPGEPVAAQIGRLFRLRNQVARREGYNDYVSYLAALYNWNIRAYETMLDRLDSVTAGPYRRLLEELRNSFGDESFDVWDWNNRFSNTVAEVDAYFPIDSQLTMARRSLEAMGFNLAKMPIYLQMETAPDSVPNVQTIAVRVPSDIRVAARLAPGLESLRALLGGLGGAVHLASVGQESELVARGLSPSWRDGMERFFGRLTVQPEWLTEYGHVPGGVVTRFSRAVEGIDLLQLRLLLVDARFELAAYRTSDRDLNDLYWQLYTDCVGLPRHDDLTPWAARVDYITSPLSCREQLLARMVAAQTRSYLVDRFGTTVDSPEIGSFLVYSFFRFGGRYDWLDMFERATDRTLSPSILVSR
jgi:hypothetical protein